MGMIVLYDFICYGLNINVKVVIDTIIVKRQISLIFIFHNKINIYKHVCNKNIHNQYALLNSIIGDMNLMRITRSMNNCDDIWAEQYIKYDRIDRMLKNKLGYNKFKLGKNHKHNESNVISYTISQVFYKFFSAMKIKPIDNND